MTVKELMAVLLKCPQGASIFMASHPKSTGDNILNEATMASKYTIKESDTIYHHVSDLIHSTGEKVVVIWP